MISYHTNFRSNPLSRKEIRKIANKLKVDLGIPTDNKYVDVTKVLELMADYYPDFSFEVLEDNAFEEGVQAESDIDKHVIYIKESVYEGAIKNNGRDRMTIAHEIFHIMLHQRSTLVLYCKDSDSIKRYENPEWQAECFAGEFLMPYSKIKNMSVQDISEQCKVSMVAARYQFTHI